MKVITRQQWNCYWSTGKWWNYEKTAHKTLLIYFAELGKLRWQQFFLPTRKSVSLCQVWYQQHPKRHSVNLEWLWRWISQEVLLQGEWFHAEFHSLLTGAYTIPWSSRHCLTAAKKVSNCREIPLPADDRRGFRMELIDSLQVNVAIVNSHSMMWKQNPP